MTAGCLLIVALAAVAIHGQSLSGDGAYHLLAGHQALRYGQNTLNLEHPPLVKLLISTPLMVESKVLAPPLRVERALTAADEMFRDPGLVHRATVRGRWIAWVLFALPLFAACFALGRHFGGAAAGWTLVLILGLSFSIFPTLTLLQTDVLLTLSAVLVALAGLRFVGRPSWLGAAALGAAVGLGLAAKFSAVVLLPAVLAAFLLPGRRAGWTRLGQLALAALVSVAIVDLTYLAANLDYTHEVGREVIRDYLEGRGTLVVDGEMHRWRELLLGVERFDPFFAQWLTGLLGHQAQNQVAPYPSYAFGSVFSVGRWWYLPAMLAIKTPLVLLAAGGLALGRLRRPSGLEWLLPGVIVASYSVIYMASNYNLGFRHTLPILPFALLPVAVVVARRRAAAVILVAALAAESLLLIPYWSSSTNTWWLGAANPTRFALGTGNTEYRLNYRHLARVAAERNLQPLHVIHPQVRAIVGQAYLPGARWVEPGRDLEAGWYAVNVTFEQYLPALLAASDAVHGHRELRGAAKRWEPTWSALRAGEDHGFVAGTFHLFRLPVDTPLAPEAAGDGAGGMG